MLHCLARQKGPVSTGLLDYVHYVTYRPFVTAFQLCLIAPRHLPHPCRISIVFRPCGLAFLSYLPKCRPYRGLLPSALQFLQLTTNDHSPAPPCCLGVSRMTPDSRVLSITTIRRSQNSLRGCQGFVGFDRFIPGPNRSLAQGTPTHTTSHTRRPSESAWLRHSNRFPCNSIE